MGRNAHMYSGFDAVRRPEVLDVEVTAATDHGGVLARDGMSASGAVDREIGERGVGFPCGRSRPPVNSGRMQAEGPSRTRGEPPSSSRITRPPSALYQWSF